jgi:hypothetical protein
MPEDFYRVVWPRGRRIVDRVPLARRLPTLEGQTIAFLWDYVFRGDEIFPILARELERRFRDVTFVPWSAFGSIYGGDERTTIAALPDLLRERRVDAVVSAVGC